MLRAACWPGVGLSFTLSNWNLRESDMWSSSFVLGSSRYSGYTVFHILWFIVPEFKSGGSGGKRKKRLSNKRNPIRKTQALIVENESSGYHFKRGSKSSHISRNDILSERKDIRSMLQEKWPTSDQLQNRALGGGGIFDADSNDSKSPKLQDYSSIHHVVSKVHLWRFRNAIMKKRRYLKIFRTKKPWKWTIQKGEKRIPMFTN